MWPQPLQSSAMADALIELNVGGVHYATTRDTLLRNRNSLPAAALGDPDHPRDARGRIFFDRDGVLFRYVLDYLRDGDVVLPESFGEHKRLAREAKHYRLVGLENAVRESDPRPPNRERGSITVGYRGSFALTRDRKSEDRYDPYHLNEPSMGVIWRKLSPLSPILVSGKVTLCKDVFGETLNVDHGLADRYASRFFLKHLFIEQAFDMLQENGFKLTASCGSGPSCKVEHLDNLYTSDDCDANLSVHYNEFVFVRE